MGSARDVLVTEPLQKQQRDLFFGRRQAPAIELLFERFAEPLHQVPCLATPAIRFGSSGVELLSQRESFDERDQNPDLESAFGNDGGLKHRLFAPDVACHPTKRLKSLAYHI